jgi:RHS repeat-associated protein
VIASGVTNTLNFVYDGWNLLASLTNSTTLFEAFTWGLDLSGSVQGSPRESGTSLTGGAGGVGGLLEATYFGSSTTNCFTAFDGNGNVSALVNASNGSVLAQYEYGPFGELIRATGPMAKLNPFRFSTKYQDDENDLLYYGYRYYNASTGRWLSKDPITELGFDPVGTNQKQHERESEDEQMPLTSREDWSRTSYPPSDEASSDSTSKVSQGNQFGFLNDASNLYGFVGNGPINAFDRLGLVCVKKIDNQFGSVKKSVLPGNCCIKIVTGVRSGCRVLFTDGTALRIHELTTAQVGECDNQCIRVPLSSVAIRG